MTTMKDILAEYAAYLKNNQMAEHTIASYTTTLQSYEKWYEDSFGEDAPAMLYRANVLDYVSFLRTHGHLAPASINSKVAALKSFNEFLVETNRQKDVVITRKDHMKIQTQYASPSTVSKQEVDALRQKILTNEGVRDYAIITLMAYGGLRVSEACNAKLEKLNLVAGELLVEGKGDKSRIVYLNSKIVHALREYLRVRPETESPYIFESRQGGAPCRQRINQILKQYSDHIRPHDLRHFYCSYALECGMTIADVANQAGHSNVRTTLRYTNPSVQALKDRINRM